MQLEQILNKEHQLGDRLLKSVTQSRRADFSFYLALLSPDALDFSEFHLPETRKSEPDKSEEILKKELQIGPQQEIAPESFNMCIGENNRALLQTHGLTELRLRNCLVPEPLHIRDDKKHISLEIIDNCEPSVQAKLFAKRENRIELDRPQMDAAGFFDQLNSGDMQGALKLTA